MRHSPAWVGRSLGAVIAAGLLGTRRDPTARSHQPGADRSHPEERVCAPEPLTAAGQELLDRTASERIAAFMDRFCFVRSDYARQWKRAAPEHPDGWAYGWARVGKRHPEQCELTPAVIEAHLRGQITVGTYLLDERNRCRMLVLDHDDKRIQPELDPRTGQHRIIPEDGLLLLQDCRERFRQQGIDSVLVESRRGGHLFVFFDAPVEARDARALAFLGLGTDEAWRMRQGHQAFEIYPKQDRRGGRAGAVGSNIALPLGVNLKDGQRHPFIDAHGHAVAASLSGQVDYLDTIERVHVRRILEQRPWLYEELDRAMHPMLPRRLDPPERAWERVAAPVLARDTPGVTGRTGTERMSERDRATRDHVTTPARSAHAGVIARWKAGVDCRDIVRAYGVTLNDSGSGCCPFHDDQHASFQAWHDGWRCYAEDRGGDALDFIMEWEGLCSRDALPYARARWPVPVLERDRDMEQPGGRG